ncbi:HalOD1 output domain-containing protein [Halosimplex salinum]|uniref:HalOD1 output domain-containing protein n=1 Tax=Halosimplex salinum TaxID=1710538 RepID=UPI000F4936EF|nr:HalOD1 output domain-containing protein [Halosimplex salinum]
MGEMLSSKVSTEIATREGVDPMQLDEPLYDVIDVSALETLVEGADDRGGGSLEVQFTYYGYDVVVDGAGEVTVTPSGAVGDSAEDAANQTRAGR